MEVQPSTPMLKVFQDACARRSLDPARHRIVYERRALDLSLPFQFSSVFNNATIEVVEIEEGELQQVSTSQSGPVRVGVRLENGDRCVVTVPNSETLLSILESLAESNPSVAQLIDRARSDGRQPEMNYLKSKVSGFTALASTRLSDLGLTGNGSALFQIRSIDFVEEQPMTSSAHSDPQQSSQVPPVKEHVAEKQVDAPVQDDAPVRNQQATRQAQVTKPSVCSDVPMQPEPEERWNPEMVTPFSIFADRTSTSMFDAGRSQQPAKVMRQQREPTLGESLGISLEPADEPYQASNQVPFKFPEKSEPVESVSSEATNGVENVSSAETGVEREALVFMRPSKVGSGPNVESDALPDSFYDVTDGDLRRLVKNIHEDASTDQPLLTQASRAQARARFYDKYARAIIQFNFSDNVVLQACFTPHETVGALYDFIRTKLRVPNQEFHLFTTPPKQILKNHSESLLESGLVPMTKVFFHSKSSNGSNVLCEALINSISDANAGKAGQVVQSWMAAPAPLGVNSSKS